MAYGNNKQTNNIGGGGGGSGDVVGPASSTDNTLARFDSTTGKLIQNGIVTESDTGTLANINAAQFDTTPNGITPTEGQLSWNSTDGTLDLGMNGGNITLQVGQESFVKVRNATGSTITDGTVVYFNGSIGNRPTIDKARSDVMATSRVQGILTEDIANNTDGFITSSGYVRQIKTNYTGSGIWGTTWVEGDLLYVSKTDAGVITNIQPSVPHHSDIIGSVGIIGGVGVGSILVNIARHQALEDLSDVNGTPLTTTGQIPVWDQTNGYFDFTSNVNDFQTIAETEVDFGTIPVNTKKFTITNASINTNSKIIVSTSGNTATDRVGNDWEFDSCNFSATAGTGNFTISVVSNGHLRGKRKLFYSFS